MSGRRCWCWLERLALVLLIVCVNISNLLLARRGGQTERDRGTNCPGRGPRAHIAATADGRDAARGGGWSGGSGVALKALSYCAR